MFTPDHFFTIGSTHTVCQDYARSGIDSNNAVAIVADGCSSSPDTDVGARILALEAMPWAKLEHDLGDLQNMLHVCDGAARILPFMRKECLDATLLVAQVGAVHIQVVVWGDGFFVIRRLDGTIVVRRVSFLDKNDEPSAHPVYPAYFANPKRLESVLEHSPTRMVTTWVIYPDGEVDHNVHLENVEEKPAYIWRGFTAYYDLVALMSDGAESFYRSTESSTWKRTETVDHLDVIKRIMAFKGMKGSFVQRRVRRVLKDLAAERISHADDFSMAAIHIDHERKGP